LVARRRTCCRRRPYFPYGSWLGSETNGKPSAGPRVGQSSSVGTGPCLDDQQRSSSIRSSALRSVRRLVPSSRASCSAPGSRKLHLALCCSILRSRTSRTRVRGSCFDNLRFVATSHPHGGCDCASAQRRPKASQSGISSTRLLFCQSARPTYRYSQCNRQVPIQ
jgi:hypothetical protein